MSFDLSIFNFTDTVLDTSSEANQVDNYIFKDQKLDKYIDDNITGSDSEKADKLEDLFESLEDSDALSEAIAYSKEEFGADVTSRALKNTDFSEAKERDNEWKEVSSVVGSVLIDENKSDIEDSIGNIDSDGKIENATLKKIYKEMVNDGLSESDALANIKTMLKNEGIKGGDNIKSIEASSSTSSTSGSEGLDKVKDKYVDELKNDNGKLRKEIDGFLKEVKEGNAKVGDPARGEKINQMAEDILATKPSSSDMSDEEYVSRAMEDILRESGEYEDDVEVRATKYYDKTELKSDAELLNEDGDKVRTLKAKTSLINAYKGDTRVDDLYITDNGEFVEKTGDDEYTLLEKDSDGNIKLSNGNEYYVDELNGKTSYHMHLGDKEDEEKVEARAKAAFKIFGHDAADIKEAKAKTEDDVEDAEAIRNAVDDEENNMKDMFGMILGVMALVGGIIAASSGNSHKTVTYGQPSYNPNAHAHTGRYTPTNQFASTLPQVQARGPAFQRTAIMRDYGKAAIEQRLYGGGLYT